MNSSQKILSDLLGDSYTDIGADVYKVQKDSLKSGLKIQLTRSLQKELWELRNQKNTIVLDDFVHKFAYLYNSNKVRYKPFDIRRKAFGILLVADEQYSVTFKVGSKIISAKVLTGAELKTKVSIDLNTLSFWDRLNMWVRPATLEIKLAQKDWSISRKVLENINKIDDPSTYLRELVNSNFEIKRCNDLANEILSDPLKVREFKSYIEKRVILVMELRHQLLLNYGRTQFEYTDFGIKNVLTVALLWENFWDDYLNFPEDYSNQDLIYRVEKKVAIENRILTHIYYDYVFGKSYKFAAQYRFLNFKEET